MGSLVPGWEASSLAPPAELQDIDETAEMLPQGYFKKLESRRLDRRSHEGEKLSPLAYPTLATMSAPHSDLHPGFYKMASERVGGAKFKPTHWEEELSTLRTAKSSTPPEPKKKDQDLEKTSKGWWRAMDGSILNEGDKEPVEEYHKPGSITSSYVPQFDVAGNKSLLQEI